MNSDDTVKSKRLIYLRQHRYMPIKRQIGGLIAFTTSILAIIMTFCFGAVSSSIIINDTIESSYQNLLLITEKLDMMTQNIENHAILILSNDYVQELLIEIKKGNADIFDDIKNVYSYLYNMIKPEFVSNISIYAADLTKENYMVNKFAYQKGEKADNSFIESFYQKKVFDVWRLNTKYEFAVNQKEDSPYTLSFYKKVYNKRTVEFLGAVELMVNENIISDLYKNIELGDSGYYFIIDGSGRIVSHPKKEQLGLDISGEVYFEQIMENNGGHQFKVNGEDCIVINKKYGKLGWNIVGIVPTSEVLKENYKLRAVLLIIAFVWIIIVAFLADLLAKCISNPIIQLKKIAIEIGNGQRNIDMRCDRNDEIGDLYNEFNKMVIKTDNLTKNLLDEQNRKNEYELALLQSQLNPHFLYNTLECICGLTVQNRNDDVIKVVKELALFYRGVLSKGEIFITVEDELNIIERYFNILTYRYPQKFYFQIECDPDVKSCCIVKLSLQPIVENAILHGLQNKRGDKKVMVCAGKRNGKIVLSVTDNGVGMSEQKIDKILHRKQQDNSRKSFGIKATDERIKLLCGEEYGVMIQSQPGEWTKVSVVFPENYKIN